MKKLSFFLAIIGFIATVGCADPAQVGNDPAEKPQNIIGRKTQEVGEFEGDQEADLQVKQSANPYAAATGAYGFAVSEVSKMAVEKQLQIFNAMNDRYPKDHEEFMREIIKGGNIQLPVLPGNRRYQYDVENHELKVVEAE